MCKPGSFGSKKFEPNYKPTPMTNTFSGLDFHVIVMFFIVGHHVHLHLGHHNVVSTLLRGLTEKKSQSITYGRTYGRRDGRTERGRCYARDTCAACLKNPYFMVGLTYWQIQAQTPVRFALLQTKLHSGVGWTLPGLPGRGKLLFGAKFKITMHCRCLFPLQHLTLYWWQQKWCSKGNYWATCSGKKWDNW